MRRGIATFAFLARLALATLACALTVTAMLWLLLPCAVEPGATLAVEAPLPPPTPAAPIEPIDTARLAAALRTPWEELRNSKIRVPTDARLDLAGATLTNVFLIGDLRDADLSRARLWECDLRGASLEGADLRGTLYDAFTRWPAGFDPRAAGAILDE